MNLKYFNVLYVARKTINSLSLIFRANIVRHGGPNVLFPRAKDSFPVGPKGENSFPGTVFED
jgi:hypothetical protein